MTDITLLLCTRDRHAKLAATLASISRAIAAAPGVTVEAVIVDNGSTDATPACLEAWRSVQSFPVLLVHEPLPGLARARNTGLARASGRVVAMTDDDCILHADFFRGVAACFAEVTGPAIIGGRILLGDPADLPVTVKLEDHPMVADATAFPGGFIMGANLAFTADVVALIGMFDERFGAGARFVSAEDTDFLFRALGRGVAVQYDPRFTVDHHHGRHRAEDLVGLLAGYSFGDGAVYAKHLLKDRRILSAIRADLSDVLRDFTDPVTPFAAIRRFYLFRLRHKLAGFVAYIRFGLRDRRSTRANP